MDRLLPLPLVLLRSRVALIAGVSVALLGAAVLVGRVSPGETRSPPGLAVRAPAPAPPASPAPPVRRPPPRSRGLDAEQVPRLAPRWDRRLRSQGELHEPLRVALADALLVQDGPSLLRVRLADGVITARKGSPFGRAEQTAGVASGPRLITSGAATVLALDGETLAPLWRRDLAGRAGGTLVAVGTERVLAVGWTADAEAPYSLHLLDAATGRVLWSRVFAKDARFCSFQADAERIYAECRSRSEGSTPFWTAALAAEGGTELWRQRLESAASGLTPNGVWLAWAESYPAVAVVVDAATGAPLRRVKTSSHSSDPPLALDGGDLVYLDEQQRVVALDVASGQVRWQKACDLDGYTRLAVAGPVYLFGSEGELQVRDRDRGELLWTWSAAPESRALSLPDVAGTRPLVIESGESGESGKRLVAFTPAKRPVPVEHAVLTGHLFGSTADAQALGLRIGRVEAQVDDRGNYRAVVSGRGTLALWASTGAGFAHRHGARRSECEEASGCAALVPLRGRGRYRLDLDIQVVPEDCH